MADQEKELTFTKEEVLAFHKGDRPGKLEVVPTKPLETQLDLSLAYSPGVSIPVTAIAENADAAYEYTARGNSVAVISNGTAILGMGNLGALASKPVMEGKCVLLKRFADISAIDLEIGTQDPEEFIGAVRYLSPSFGAINLEDIKAPDCFLIEGRLREVMDIPVFHDDQHGTAVVVLAGLFNALELTGRTIENIRVVINGAGAAGIACLELMKASGLPPEAALLCDTKGVIYKGRKEGMNPWKEAHAVETKCRSLLEACEGADVFVGLSSKGSLSEEMVRSMNASPIIFALANPDPEMTPEEVAKVRDDAIVATGRSDYPNQVNNVLCFPYIFRGALDVRATTINDAMKIACAKALAQLARDGVFYDMASHFSGKKAVTFGPKYVVPFIFDARLIRELPVAVAQAAQETGVARRPLDLKEYKQSLTSRLNTTSYLVQNIANKIRSQGGIKKVVFAEGEETLVVRAAVECLEQGLATPVLVGVEERVFEKLEKIGKTHLKDKLLIANARTAGEERREEYVHILYEKLQRKGYLRRDCLRLVHTDRNIFSACMLEAGHADALITGVTRHYSSALDDISKVIAVEEGKCLAGVSLISTREKNIFIADVVVNHDPSAEELAKIALQTAEMVQKFGCVPRVAFISQSTFGNDRGYDFEHQKNADYLRIQKAMDILRQQEVEFEFDGEMDASLALSRSIKERYPFCRLSEPANVLIMPSQRSALISAQLLMSFQNCFSVGPILLGLSRSVQIVPMDATVSSVIHAATLSLYHPSLEKM